MKNFSIFICSCLILIASCTSSNKKNEGAKDSLDIQAAVFPEDTHGISDVIPRFARAYISQDNEKANALIHPDSGLYVVYRPGAADAYEKVDSLDFSRPVPDYFPYPIIENNDALSFEALPVFDCGSETWDKEGFVCDTTSQARQLTEIATFNYEFEGITEAELHEIKQQENDTFRIILTNGDGLIFHVKKYQDKWYVFVLDRGYGGCDA